MRAVLIALAVMASGAAWAESIPSFWGHMTGPVYRGPRAAPDLSTREAYNYRTRLRHAASLPPNFASSYRLVTWGRGATCETGAVINQRSGRVVFLPIAICCTASEEPRDIIEFRQDSSLVVFTGLRNSEQPDGRHFYNFDGNGFSFLGTRPLSGEASTASAPDTATAPPASTPKPNRGNSDDRIEASIKRLGYCARPKIQYGQYSSLDGGKSALNLMQTCVQESGEYLDACKADKGGVDPDNSCSVALLLAVQLMLKEMGR